MFRIPSFNQMEMSWDEAVTIIKGRGAGNILQGMEEMNDLWMRHVKGNSPYEHDEDFFDNWVYEVNAYNVVFAGFNKLFHGETA